MCIYEWGNHHAKLCQLFTDTVINVLMIFTMLVGFFRIKKLKFIAGSEDKTDLLMVITSFGILVYSVFTIVAGCLNDNSFEPPALVVANGLADFVQVNIQLLFIADLKHRRIHDNNPKYKPGRQIVTFLLITNLGLWITYNFEIQKVNVTPDQSEFYGFFPWAVIQRITLPLCVFFRFHSTVVLSELWKNCYQLRKHNENS